ncbi:FliM/FliN family flagellar motor switch protein [Ensifer adhaerens]|uniref:FliM/FliN family flagellar motor switch protein n=1 Tax=Ensifer adhaerens TaxID=106592 RepID=UPI001CBBBDBD|nr:FliM/FliN family flagellar motor switch protein [Ensifer adhaerens]MBZ7926713.1 FliM/FliN family flagellar motor switch protein [Ensifer adhaerens]UAX96961.1 FliM/FliN family flagellar motor switch protein [Ensifer adhaerens]UAY03693.1 FliM/FliN family flagellar motor switch protein [Ensifer adhaerens]UAY11677.1 FliM/FliN family flagellar motor switch protein [Ensifer adhaerens]
MINKKLQDELVELDVSPALESRSVMSERAVQGIPLAIEAIIGRARLTVSQISKLHPDDTIHLDRNFGDPVELKVNGMVIGRGEIVYDESSNAVGIKIIEITPIAQR